MPGLMVFVEADEQGLSQQGGRFEYFEARFGSAYASLTSTWTIHNVDECPQKMMLSSVMIP